MVDVSRFTWPLLVRGMKAMAKGQVKVEAVSGRIRLRWSHSGKRHCLSLGLPDNAVNQSFAVQRAKQIELDMVSGNFDATLEKYKPAKAQQKKAKPQEEQKAQTFDQAYERHWDNFVEYKRSRVDNPFTIVSMYRPLVNKLAAFGKPIRQPDDARLFVEWLLTKISGTTAKKYVGTLNNFSNWLIAQQLIEPGWQDPFTGLKEICKEQPKLKLPPFTKEEITEILAAFACDKDYAYYLGYVRFLFLTGCRTSEAIGLRWRHINDDCSEITFIEASVRKGTGVARLQKATKTNRTRTFPCNQELQALLFGIKPEQCSPNDLVFPSPRGKCIDATNFLNRAWKTILRKCEMTEENGRYRCQYNTRHTFISHMLAQGMSVVEVAKLTGHDPKVLLDHYAGLIKRVEVPSFF